MSVFCAMALCCGVACCAVRCPTSLKLSLAPTIDPDGNPLTWAQAIGIGDKFWTEQKVYKIPDRDLVAIVLAQTTNWFKWRGEHTIQVSLPLPHSLPLPRCPCGRLLIACHRLLTACHRMFTDFCNGIGTAFPPPSRRHQTVLERELAGANRRKNETKIKEFATGEPCSCSCSPCG